MFSARYGYASQNGSYYSGSVGSQELIDMYGDEEDSVFTDDSYGEGMSAVSGGYSTHSMGSRHQSQSAMMVSPSVREQHSMMMARSQDRLNSMARMSTRSYSLGRQARVLSDPSLVHHRHSSPRHSSVGQYQVSSHDQWSHNH